MKRDDPAEAIFRRAERIMMPHTPYRRHETARFGIKTICLYKHIVLLISAIFDWHKGGATC